MKQIDAINAEIEALNAEKNKIDKKIEKLKRDRLSAEGAYILETFGFPVKSSILISQDVMTAFPELEKRFDVDDVLHVIGYSFFLKEFEISYG